jgi:hypothetical protein
MPVYIDKILFQDEFTGTQSGGSDKGVNYLKGCVGDFMYVTINFHVGWSVTNTPMTFNGVTQTITWDNCNVVQQSFQNQGFQVGDTIVITGTSVNDGTYTIYSLTANTIITNEAIPQNGSFASVNIYGTTTVNALDFYYNQIGNNNPVSFLSLTDSKSVQKFSGVTPSGYLSTSTLKPNSASQAWYVAKLNGVTCVPTITNEGNPNSSNGYTQNFQMVFPFLITPLYNIDQFSIIQSALTQSKGGIENAATFDLPSYFTNQALTFIYQIDAKFTVASTGIDHTSVTTANQASYQSQFYLPNSIIPSFSYNASAITGNTSWFNQFFPAGSYSGGSLLTQLQYAFKSITYAVGGNTVTAIDYANTTVVTLTIKLTTGSAASFTTAPFVLNFCYLPMNQSALQGYSGSDQADYRSVLLHDRCKTSVGAGSTNGDQYGTAYQALTSVTATISGGNLVITFSVAFGSTSLSVFKNAALNDKNYLIWITPQNNSVTSLAAAQRSAIIGDVNLATTSKDDATLLTISTNNQTDVYFYKYGDTVNPVTNLDAFYGEYAVVKVGWKVIPKAQMQSINVSIVYQVYVIATSQVLSEYVLEQWNNSVSEFWDGSVNQVAINQTKGYDLPIGDVRNKMTINRNSALDIANTYYCYEMWYGFRVGFEYWQALQNFDPASQLWHNNYWPGLSQAKVDSGSALITNSNNSTRVMLRIDWVVNSGGTSPNTTYTRYATINALDDGNNPADVTFNILTQDVYGNNLSQVIASDRPTVIIAQITSSTTNLNVPGGYSTAVGELCVVYNNGNKQVCDMITSLDSVPETKSSLWTSSADVSIDSNTGLSAYIFATFDASQAKFPITNATILARLVYRK